MKNSLVYFVFALFLILIDQFIKLWMHFDVLPNHFGEINLIDGDPANIKITKPVDLLIAEKVLEERSLSNSQ